jgi:hypothetical protein
LGDNFSGVVSPTQFSFSGGLPSITNFNATSYSFDIQTSDIGAIIAWSISLHEAGLAVFTSNTGDSSSSLGPISFIGASNSGMPGMWSVAATPIPAALPLFVTGLGGLGLLGWRRRRLAARK